jgi:hypothetical protein
MEAVVDAPKPKVKREQIVYILPKDHPVWKKLLMYTSPSGKRAPSEESLADNDVWLKFKDEMREICGGKCEICKKPFHIPHHCKYAEKHSPEIVVGTCHNCALMVHLKEFYLANDKKFPSGFNVWFYHEKTYDPLQDLGPDNLTSENPELVTKELPPVSETAASNQVSSSDKKIDINNNSCFDAFDSLKTPIGTKIKNYILANPNDKVGGAILYTHTRKDIKAAVPEATEKLLDKISAEAAKLDIRGWRKTPGPSKKNTCSKTGTDSAFRMMLLKVPVLKTPDILKEAVSNGAELISITQI